jgi:hypothetical protein
MQTVLQARLALVVMLCAKVDNAFARFLIAQQPLAWTIKFIAQMELVGITSRFALQESPVQQHGLFCAPIVLA